MTGEKGVNDLPEGLDALIEAMAQADHAHTGRFTDYGAQHPCPPGDTWTIHDPASDGFESLEDAAAFIARHAGDESWMLDVLDGDLLDVCYRDAAKVLHPDVGGDTAEFQRLNEARRILNEART
jgi:hypothetical protein